MTTCLRMILGVSAVLSALLVSSLHAQAPESREFSADDLTVQPRESGELPGARSGGWQVGLEEGISLALQSAKEPRVLGGANRPVEVRVVTGKRADGKPDTTALTGHSVGKFQYAIGSFKPVEIPVADISGGSMMGGGMMGGGMMGLPVHGDGADGTQPKRIIGILAFALDERQDDGRAKLELLVPIASSRDSQNYGGGSMGSMMGGGGYDGGSMGSMMGGSGYGDGGMGSNWGGYGGGEYDPGKIGTYGQGMGSNPSNTLNIGRYRRLSDLVDVKDAAFPVDVHLSREEFQIISQFCRLKIWKADAVAAIQLGDHAPESDTMAENEQRLKQLLTEEFDMHLARQELEVQTIEQRITTLKQEIERRRQARDRVIDVQLGRIVLEAQGLLGR